MTSPSTSGMPSKNMLKAFLGLAILASAIALVGCGEKEEQVTESPTAGLTATVPPPVSNPKGVGAPKKMDAGMTAGAGAAGGGAAGTSTTGG